MEVAVTNTIMVYESNGLLDTLRDGCLALDSNTHHVKARDPGQRLLRYHTSHRIVRKTAEKVTGGEKKTKRAWRNDGV